MRLEFPINHKALLERVGVLYGVQVMRLEYLGVGMVNAYCMTGPDGVFFLKLFPKTPYGQEAALRLAGEHALLEALHRHALLERIPKPIKTLQGATRSSLDGMVFVVYEWIEGQDIWGQESDHVAVIAEILGRLHRGASVLKHSNLPVPPEDFSWALEKPLYDDLLVLKRAGRHDRIGVQMLRDVLLPWEGELLALLAKTKALPLNPNSDAWVVAHTDLHGGNLLRDAQQRFWAIDWETARFAPPEHDLWMYAHLQDFLPMYGEAFGKTENPNRVMLEFYLQRRLLEDLAEDLQQTLHGHVSDEQDVLNIANIKHHILKGWEDLQIKLERVRVF